MKGGQRVYVAAADGALSYNTTSSPEIPLGSIDDRFSKEALSNGGNDQLNFETGWLACPASTPEAGYQVFGQIDGTSFGAECIGFSLVTCEL
jgi:hypothetical protein